jgi:hypothetical protein
MPRAEIELLAPARDADIGIEAINHGADAVYIGGPAFGAREKAGNSIADIERLVRHAHRWHARIFVTHNTILRDDELETGRRLACDPYRAGVDALLEGRPELKPSARGRTRPRADDDGHVGRAAIHHAHEPAHSATRAEAALREGAAGLAGSLFEARPTARA